jgi:hypothetical protein
VNERLAKFFLMGKRASTLKWTILVMAGLFVFSYALKRDLLYERSYTGDLRNRVVGARIIKDNGSPYFYKWKKGEGFRYYDPGNFDAAHPSAITTSPFFEQLLSPVADLPQSQIELFWLIFEYIVLARAPGCCPGGPVRLLFVYDLRPLLPCLPVWVLRGTMVIPIADSGWNLSGPHERGIRVAAGRSAAELYPPAICQNEQYYWGIPLPGGAPGHFHAKKSVVIACQPALPYWAI